MATTVINIDPCRTVSPVQKSVTCTSLLAEANGIEKFVSQIAGKQEANLLG